MEETTKTSLWETLIGIVIVLVVYLVARAYIVPTPEALTLPIPYTTQAPDGQWAGNENCEEASATMANAYLNGDTENVIPAAAALQQINALVDWENTNFGHSANTGVDQTSQMLEQALNLKTKIDNGYTEADLKAALVKHEVILMPLNIQGLHNPNYPTDAPTYHMVVVRGYNDQGFILNDPGINEGENTVYSFNTLYAAGANWNQDTKTMDTKTKAVIFVSK